MDKLKKQEENFALFEDFINDLSVDDAKSFIIEFFKQYKYLLNEEITRVTDRFLLKAISKRKNI